MNDILSTHSISSFELDSELVGGLKRATLLPGGLDITPSKKNSNI